MSYALSFKQDDAIEVGIDEAGRGCLFGRLYVGAVVFPKQMEDFFDHGATLQTIRDSKTLTERKRNILYDYIQEAAIDKAVAFVESTDVDTYNVLQADLRCMRQALDALTVPIDRILVDGDHWKPWNDVEAHTIVDGDASYLNIAAAGILAKVSRDRWIAEVCEEHPEWNEQYGLLKNKGYGTPTHMRGIQEHGVTAQHRRSYAPVARALGLPTPPKESKAKKGWQGD
jgi:ribonuclease HII